eukprot:UN12644
MSKQFKYVLAVISGTVFGYLFLYYVPTFSYSASYNNINQSISSGSTVTISSLENETLKSIRLEIQELRNHFDRIESYSISLMEKKKQRSSSKADVEEIPTQK